MKTLVRSIVWLVLAAWLGSMLFFPVAAWAAFSTIADTHAAGTIVAKCLHILYTEGLYGGTLLVLLLGIGYAIRAFRQTALTGIVVTLVMLALTAFAQYSIIPRMEAYRLAAGGAIDNVEKSDPRHVGFDQLHQTSEHVLMATIAGGIVLVVLLAHASGETRQR